jgi:sortase A
VFDAREVDEYPVEMESVEHQVSQPRHTAAARWGRWVGTALMLCGVLTLAWVVVVWQWNDPFTSLYTRWEQRKLTNEYEAVAAQVARQPPLIERGASKVGVLRATRAAAARFRAGSAEGAPIGRIEVPKLGLKMILVNGTGSSSLRKGPARDRRTFMPGQGELVYIAGHRTTYLAPFADIDTLARGDVVRLRMPYATVDYAVTRHRIVDDQDLSVLRSRGREEVALQACHPRFFATQRYIVWAVPTAVTPRGGPRVVLRSLATVRGS